MVSQPNPIVPQRTVYGPDQVASQQDQGTPHVRVTRNAILTYIVDGNLMWITTQLSVNVFQKLPRGKSVPEQMQAQQIMTIFRADLDFVNY